MRTEGFSLFETAIGSCGVAWGPRGLTGVQLPEATETATRSRMLRRFAPAHERHPSQTVERVIAEIVRLLEGVAVDLGWIDLDMSGIAAFPARVYGVARSIPVGSTLSYGEIAARLGQPTDARLVGDALAKNPFPIVVPCHRVLASDGRPSGFSAAGGVMTKLRLLSIERVQAPGTLPLFESPA